MVFLIYCNVKLFLNKILNPRTIPLWIYAVCFFFSFALAIELCHAFG